MDDELGQPDEGAAEAVNRLAESIQKSVSYHVNEYHLTAAAVVGTLAIEAIKRTLDAIAQGREDEAEDDE